MTRFGMGICSQQASRIGSHRRRQPYDRGWVNHFSQGLSQLSGCSVHRFSCFCITCGSSFHGLYPAPRISERSCGKFLPDMRHVFFGNVNLAQGMWWFFLQDRWVRWVLRCLPSQFQEAIHTLKAAGHPRNPRRVGFPRLIFGGTVVLGSKSLNKGRMSKSDELRATNQ